MARQAKTPVQFNQSTRRDNVVGVTSFRAGLTHAIDYIPLLRGDSASGSFSVSLDLAEMPKPLMNAVQANLQAWFVPKSAHPQFAGYDEFMHSYQGQPIKALGETDRSPPTFFSKFPDSTAFQGYRDSTFMTVLGAHVKGYGAAGRGHNADLLDAFNLIWNFRAAAHSSRIPRRDYVLENPVTCYDPAAAFWPSGRFAQIVPDYERALVVGSLDLDVIAGQVPIEGIRKVGTGTGSGDASALHTVDYTQYTAGGVGAQFDVTDAGSNIFGELEGQTIGITLADIDKARTTQAFAKLRTAYAGNDATGFDNDDAIVAELMQGFAVPDDMFKRPWLLDSKRVTFGMNERHATDGASLDESVTKGRASATLSLNVPRQDTGGVIIITCEILPERLHERAGDPWLHVNKTDDYPDALRDVQRPEPVDLVQNWRLDEEHTDPSGLYGYEPMNAKWDREYSRLGGKFIQRDPLNPFTEARAALWLAEVPDPEFTADHYLAPVDFPHDVFSDTLGDAVEIAYRHNVAIRGLTQFGDVLAENNDDYDAVAEA